jgi:hypothetical protein
MSLTTACFEDVIGLSRTDCDCFGTPPVGFDTSASGIYLDEVPGLNLEKIFASAGCSEDGWDILTRARENGLRKMKSEVVRAVQLETKVKRPIGRSIIGKEKGSKSVTLGKSFHGLDLKFDKNVIGGTAVVKRIGGAFKFTGSVVVTVYDIYGDTVATRTIAAVQNKLNWTDIEEISIYLSEYTSDSHRFWFLFQPTSGQSALDYKIASCGCTGKPRFSVDAPFRMDPVVLDGQNWTAWARCGGTYGNDFESREDWQHANETQGLALDIDFKCDANTVICSGEPNYAQDEVQMSFAAGVQLYSALEVIAEVTKSTRVNREAIAGGDEMELTRVGLIKDAKDVVDFIVQVLTSDPDEGNPRSGVNLYSDCFTCKDPAGMAVKPIRR